MIAAFPLQWPKGRGRAPRYRRKGDPFHMPSGKIRSDLARELHLMGADDFIVSSDLMIRNDGLPYAGQRSPADPGIALYFTRKGQEICISCDQYVSIDANLRAIGKTVEAIRGIERWGTEEMMDRAFTGFAELPANAGATADVRAWHEVLGVRPDSSPAVIRAAYRDLAKTAHPDTGGSQSAWLELQRAYRESGEADV